MLRSNKCYINDLPEFPLAGDKAAEQLQKVCKDKDCKYIGDYLYDLYVFKMTYELYKEE
jgi:hypothetical protein